MRHLLSADRFSFVSILILTTLFFLGCTPLQAQGGAPQEWASGFSLEGMDVDVLASAVFDDGSGPALYVGGGFLAADGEFMPGVAKWDGTSWTPVGSGMNGWVRALAVFDDGTGPALYAGGIFTKAGGIAANRVAKWDGTSWTPLGTGTNDTVNDLAVYDDGTGAGLYVAGRFTVAGGAPAGRIAQWNGTGWIPLGLGVNGDVKTLTVHDGGGGPDLYVGGEFRLAQGILVEGVARWDGNMWSALGTGYELELYDLISYNDGTSALYGAGQFRKDADGFFHRGVARWDGAAWTRVGNDNLSNYAKVLGVHHDGISQSLYAGGNFFIDDGGTLILRVARWDGAAWQALGTGMNDEVLMLASYNDGSGPALYAGGQFTGAGDAPAYRIARWDGTAWSVPTPAPFGNGLNSWINAFAEYDDGDGPALYAAGNFTYAGESAASRIAKWDGVSWSALGGDPADGFDREVDSLAVFDGGGGPELYAGGQFKATADIPADHIVRWDGTSWSAVGSGSTSWVQHMVVHDDGSGPALFALGRFNNGDGGIGKWDGTSWTLVGSEIEFSVKAIASYQDGEESSFVIGGALRSVNGVPVNGAAQWDGVEWKPLGFGPEREVLAFTVYDDGSGPALYAAGRVDRQGAGAAGVSFISRWNGSSWTPLAVDIDGFVDTLTTYDDGSGPALYAGGRFTAIEGISMNRVAKWDGTEWSPIGGGLNQLVNVLYGGGDGSGPALYAGGSFTFAGAVPSAGIAKAVRAPKLNVTTLTHAIAGGDLATLAVRFHPADSDLAATTFSLDYDETCLDPDLDNDGTLDGLVLNVPADFTVTTDFNSADTTGEIDISITDLTPPFAALPPSDLLTIDFQTVCAGTPGTSAEAPVVFSQASAPTFTDTVSNPVEGLWSGGSVRIWPDGRGDCNFSNVLSSDDLLAIAEEIFDGDGDHWSDAFAWNFPGSPVGCDANASEKIDAADVACAAVLIAGQTCAAAPLTGAGIAELEVQPRLDGATVWIGVGLTANGQEVSSIALSLNLDQSLYDIDDFDIDRDGVPDLLNFPQGEPGVVYAAVDDNDTEGELDLLIADPAAAALPEGILIEVGIPMSTLPVGGIGLSEAPSFSLGTPQGGSLPGRVLLPTIFADGFESGDTTAWSASVGD